MDLEISVVLAVYNSEKYLKQCMDSILSQTYKDFEFIIVNDGSTDGTREILDRIEDSRVHVIHMDTNRGVAFARNLGIERARGEWIVFHDGDDISLPTRIEEQFNYLKERPELVAVGSKVKCIVDHDNKKDVASLENWINSHVTREQIRHSRYYGNPVIHPTLMVSKAAFTKTGGYDPQYKACEDYDVLLNLLELGPIENVPNVLFHYRVDPSSRSQRDIILTNNEVNIISIRHIKKLCLSKKGFQPSQPTFAVFGPDRARENFENNIIPSCGVSVAGYFHRGKEHERKYAVSLYEKGNIDGVIVLEHRHARQICNNLRVKGMELNRNLFRMTNFIM